MITTHRFHGPRARFARLLLATTALALACDGGAPETPAGPVDPRAGAPPGGLPVVELVVRGRGTITVELFPHKAPRTVENFLELAAAEFYDGTTFHRVIPGFVIQGGDPLSKDRDPRNDGQGGPGHSIPGELNDVPHRRGTLSMAHTGRPESAGSQFFIVLADQPAFDGHYVAFGEVVSGMEVVEAIAAVEVDRYGRWGAKDRPREDVVVERVRLVPAS